MPRCFVIQPFDGAKFDKRYDDVFKPAIEAAGLEPYRVDRDPSVEVPIDDINAGIAAAAACLADITTDNPNVWFELGVAISTGRPVVLICSNERDSRFPFDVQHRSILKYSTESSSDFDRLRESVTTRLKAQLENAEALGSVARMSPIADVQGLQQHEIAALVSVAQRVDAPEDVVTSGTVRTDMEAAGFTEIATSLAIRSLSKQKLMDVIEDSDMNGNRFFLYRPTDRGIKWLLDNQNLLKLRSDRTPFEPRRF